MKQSTINKIQAELKQRNTYPSYRHMNRACGVTHRTMVNYEQLFGSLRHRVERSVKNRRELTLKELQKGESQVKRIAKKYGMCATNLSSLINSDPELAEIIRQNREEAKKERYRNVIAESDKLFSQGVTQSEIASMVKWSVNHYYRACEYMGVKPWAERQREKQAKPQLPKSFASMYSNLLTKPLVGVVNAA